MASAEELYLSAGEDLANHLCTKKNAVVVKESSVVEALRHYKDMPEMVRVTKPLERHGEYNWHKLKRGKQRILVRSENNTLYFTLYQRRDWQYPTA